MKGHLTTFTDLFRLERDGTRVIEEIEIPLIQRDYAQGRPGAAVEEIRTNFLRVLFDAITEGPVTSLDFVYGQVQDPQDGAEGKKLHPLDGQQRLTTLFLLHWYVASEAGVLDPSASWTRFSYATRFSARRFCERLTENPLPPGAETPSEWIVDQPWYLHLWRGDPTIQSMLVMVDAIHAEAARRRPSWDAAAAWRRLTDADDPAVSFYLLPLDDMESDENLYIKMNSRGKPLTPFENFKARFEQDIQHSDRADEFAHKIDGPWSDLFWPFHGGDNIVDDEFVRYIDFLVEICELRDDRVVTGRLGDRARDVFGPGHPRADDNLDFLFSSFDTWLEQGDIVGFFDQRFATVDASINRHDPEKTVLFATNGVNLFEQCVHQFDSQKGGNRAFSLQQSLLLYAVLIHLIHGTEEFPRRIRVLRNLIAASEDEIRRDRMPDLVGDVERLIREGNLDDVTRLSVNQVEDERRKRDFLAAHPHLSEALFRLEDHPILRGTLTAFTLEPHSFTERVHAFEAAFANPDEWSRLTGALLATGDYQRQRPRSTAWQFGTSSPRNEGVWRYLLTSGTEETLAGIRTVLADFLDGVAESDADVSAHCDSVMSGWLKERESRQHFDWRYYLVRYPEMRSGDTGIYYGSDGEMSYSLCMLRTQQRNGYYRDPILLSIWRMSDVDDRVENPWFTGYETTPRWLRLVNSGAGVRSVATGLALRPPETDAAQQAFLQIRERYAAVETAEDGLVVPVPQVDGVDTTDRVVLGAELLQAMVAADL